MRFGVVLLVAALSLGAASPCARTAQTNPSTNATLALPESEFRGRLICIAEEMHRTHGIELTTGHAHIPGFRSTNGSIYTLLETRFSRALFIDPRLREKELLLKAALLPHSQVLDVHSIRSFKEGRVHDLYYYCDICDIQAVSPDPCACCQAPVELVEKPVDEPRPGGQRPK